MIGGCGSVEQLRAPMRRVAVLRRVEMCDRRRIVTMLDMARRLARASIQRLLALARKSIVLRLGLDDCRLSDDLSVLAGRCVEVTAGDGLGLRVGGHGGQSRRRDRSEESRI